MKKLLLPLLFLTQLSWAQVSSFKPNTGDAGMDGFLQQVNNDAQKDMAAFKNMVVNKFNIAKNDIDKLLTDMVPGDVYMAAQVSSIISKPVTEVSSVYTKNKGKGWGAIAREMGIKPGSAEFHKLKESMKKHEGGKSEEDGGGKGHGHGNGHGKNK